MHPPAYILSRRPTEDVVIDKYRFRKGCAVVISPYALHHDERSWGSDAEQFRHLRWLREDGAFDETAPGQPRAYLPFGAGSRMCIGAGFAVMEATLLLARLATQWRVEFAPGFVPSPRRAVPARTHAGDAALALVEASHPQGGLGAVAHLELGQHVRDVVLHGLEADAERAGDLGVAAPVGDQREHLAPPAR